MGHMYKCKDYIEYICSEQGYCLTPSSNDLKCYHTHEQISIKIHLPLGFILTDISGCQIES